MNLVREVAVSLQGTFDVFSLGELLRMLAGSGKTGALVVEAGGVAGRIDLADGECCAAETVELRGAVSSADELHARLVDVCFAVVREATGVFRFTAGEPPAFELSARVSIEAVLAEVDLLVAEWNEITELIPSLELRPVLAETLPGSEITLTAAEWGLLARLDGYTSVRDLVDGRRHTMVEVCRSIADLVTRGAVDLVDDAAGSRAQGVVHETPPAEVPYYASRVMPVEPYGPGVDEATDEPMAAETSTDLADMTGAALGDPALDDGGDDDARDRGAILRLFSALREG